MTFSPLTSRMTYTARWNGYERTRQRPHPPTIFIVHHCAGPMQAAINRAANPAEQLSYNYTIHERNGEIVGGISEKYGAWTSGAPYADSIAVTVEVGNIGYQKHGSDNHPESWEISEAAFDSLARLIADWATRYNRPINRQTVIGHREVVTRYGEGYGTACPGGWLWARMETLIDLANKYKAQGLPDSTGEEEMTPAQMKELKSYIDARTRSAAGSQAQIVKNGDGHWLEVGTGRVGIWGRDLSAIRSAIVSLNWQRRDGAGPEGKSDVAFAKGGPGPHAYNIFDAYRRAAVEGRKITSPLVKEVKVKGGASGGSAALAHIDDVAPGLDGAPATVDVFEVDESTEES